MSAVLKEREATIGRYRVDIPEALPALLHACHDAQPEMLGQSVTGGGTQFNLSPFKWKALAQLQRSLRTVIGAYVGGPWFYSGIWSTRLTGGAAHMWHNHPEGRYSGVCYIEAPEGCAELIFPQNGKLLTPKPGDVVIFPSGCAHGTTIHTGDVPRLTIAFDAKDAH